MVRNASGLGLRGFVRNNRDGEVEAVFAGDSLAVDEMVERCRTGPRHAAVSGIETSPFEGSFESFEILPTA